MTEKTADAARGMRARLSARRIILVAMMMVVALFALLDAVRFFRRAWLLPEAGVSDRAGQIAAALSDGVKRAPEGSTILVLLLPGDYREIAYVVYHAPPSPDAPLKLSSPESQAPVPFEGRSLLFAWYDPSRPPEIAKMLASRNDQRPGSRLGGAVMVSWRLAPEGETAFALLYDAEGRVK